MDSRRFDALTRAFAAALPRRRLVRRLSAGLVALPAALRLTSAVAQDAAATVELASIPCACSGNRCQRCLIGLTGGGVVSTASGEAQLVLFASRLEVDSDDPAAGFVRWVVSRDGENPLSLESIGTIAYGPVEGDEQAREVRGTMQVNGAGEYPFVLRAVDLGTAELGRDTASLRVGNRLAEGSDFGYEEEGTIVGGDLQLLDTVGPIASP